MRIENNNNNIKFNARLCVIKKGKGFDDDFYKILREMAKKAGKGTIFMSDNLISESKGHRHFREIRFDCFQGRDMFPVENGGLVIKEQIAGEWGEDVLKFVERSEGLTFEDFKALIINKFSKIEL